MYLCLCMHAHTYVCIVADIHDYVCVHSCVYVCMYVHTYINAWMYTYICIDFMYVCLHSYLHVFIHIGIHTHIYIGYIPLTYTYMHTYICHRLFLSLCKEILNTGPKGLKTLTGWMLNYIYYDLFHTSLWGLKYNLGFSEIADNEGQDLRMEKDSRLGRLWNSKNSHEYKYQ